MDVRAIVPIFQDLVPQESLGIESSVGISCLPEELILEVFSCLNAEELARCRRVSRVWHLCANDESLWKKLLPKIAFGPQEWSTYFGECEKAPSLPEEIYKILKSRCPFWLDKKVEETHLLVFVPQTVDGKPLTLMSLGQLVKKPKEGPATRYRHVYEGAIKKLGLQTTAHPHWVLMTKKVIPGSLGQSYADQQVLLTQLNIEAEVEYAFPSVLEAAICVFMHYVKTQERLLSDAPYAYTRCHEKEIQRQFDVGGFCSAGLDVDKDCFSYYIYGLAPLRIFS